MVPDYDPDVAYTDRELQLITEKMLLLSGPCTSEPMWLNWPMYMHRLRTEIYTNQGTPDPSIVEGLYWKTHPQGRKFKKKREKREAFYA
jgi:hypothetical protein